MRSMVAPTRGTCILDRPNGGWTMTSILLSYARSDEAEAKKLLAVLERAGHKVLIANFDQPALQRTDIVLVIWSSAALTSPYVYEQARVALSSNRLVQVTTA